MVYIYNLVNSSKISKEHGYDFKYQIHDNNSHEFHRDSPQVLH